MRASLMVYCLVLSFLCSYSTHGQTQSLARKPLTLTTEDQKVVDTCLDIIRGCQLPDGVFVQTNGSPDPTAQVWIAPYFANYAVLALLTANDAHKNPADVVRVGKWLEWCATNQDKGGFWYDYIGPAAAYKSNGHVDAYDSSAALFLIVVACYQRVGGTISHPVKVAAKRALTCIQTVTAADGLTWAKPDYKIKYLMDNIEVYAGLASAQKLFTATGDVADAKAAGDQKTKVSKGLQTYWKAKVKIANTVDNPDPEIDKSLNLMQQTKRFAWAMDEEGAFEGGMGHLYPQGLAQLFGVSFVTANRIPFTEVVQRFEPETTPQGTGAERYLIAASRLGGADATEWRRKVINDATSFTPQNVYIFRPGLVVLGLLAGADWMPNIAGGN